jgi:ABC-type branched-subunit amino acid transport system ATPase component
VSSAEATLTPAPTGRVVLSARGLSKFYGPFRAVDAVDLDVHERDIHVFIGPNGAGKSTVLNLLGGQILPSEGEVFFDGQPLGTTKPSWRARAGIGRSFQLTSIVPGFTCLQNVVLAVQAQRGLFSLLRLKSRAQDIAAAEALLDLLTCAAPPMSRPNCCRTAISASWKSRSPWVGGRACCCSTSRPRG